jgi:hypothetical protein
MLSMGGAVSKNGTVTVKATGIPAGDIVVVGVETTGQGRITEAVITSPPAPTCIAPAAVSAVPPSNGGSDSQASTVSNGA